MRKRSTLLGFLVIALLSSCAEPPEQNKGARKVYCIHEGDYHEICCSAFYNRQLTDCDEDVTILNPSNVLHKNGDPYQ